MADGVDVAVADGGALPQGLTLSSSGVLSGIPEEVGRFPVPLTLSRHGDRATTAVIELQVGVHPGALVISQFRTLAPGDWFVQVVNTTDVPIELTGWSVAAQQVGEEETSEVPLGTGPLEPGGTAVVTNPFSSLRSQLVVTGLSGGEVPIESGFAIVAPNGAVTDAAGVDGALSNLAEGTGLSYPSQLRKEHLRYAFVRSGFDVGEPVDTDDNATDFSFAPVVGVEFPPDDPDPAAVRVDFDVAAPVFGQPVTATATVTGVVASTDAVQFAVDGAAVGPPVILVDGSATSTVLDALPVGSHVVTATFRPSGSGAVLVGEGRLTVGRAATTTAVSVRANALSAKVTPVAPGAGDPTGTVTFLVDGVEVGTALIESGVATLARAAAGGATRTIGAAYAGDDSFTGSSGSTARQDPKITARVSSTKPRRKTGWYRTPVTVTFSCTPAGAPLTEPCPAPVTLRREGAGRVVTRTVVATDGGVATVVVSPINIDRTGPKVRIRGIRGPGARGWPPRGTCVATDALSGVASCTLSRRIRPKRVVYVVVAADRAGNTSTRRVVLMRER